MGRSRDAGPKQQAWLAASLGCSPKDFGKGSVIAGNGCSIAGDGV